MNQQNKLRRATISFCLESLKFCFRFSLLPLFILLTGCPPGIIGGIFGPDPEVKSFDFHPMYFCSGDEITVTWDTRDIDKIELRTNSGEVKLSTVWPSGTLTTPPIDKNMLPLRVRGYVGDDYEEREVDNLINIDNPTWTASIPSDDEVSVPDSLRRVLAYNDEVMLADGSRQVIPVYKLYLTYRGFYWRKGDEGSIPSFSQKAKIDKIRNVTGPMLKFHSYANGSVTIGAGQEGDINPNWPGQIAAFRGDYHPGPVEHFFGWQHGTITKPEEDWFYIEEIYQEATAQVKLLVFCEQQ